MLRTPYRKSVISSNRHDRVSEDDDDGINILGDSDHDTMAKMTSDEGNARNRKHVVQSTTRLHSKSQENEDTAALHLVHEHKASGASKPDEPVERTITMHSNKAYMQYDPMAKQKHKDKKHVTLWTDWSNVLLLVLLYTIQGVPTGLVFGSVPFLIQQRTSYTDLGILSLCGYPYSLKILWSPIVDSYSISWIGRRKTWILPTQLLAGGVMIFISGHVNEMFFGETINMFWITATFFGLVLLMATQDIAVDGWALEILHERNIGYASTCQTIGLALGHFISYTIFLALNSPEFCNSYLRSADQQSTEGVLSLASYLWFWGVIFVIVSVLVVLKKEKDIHESNSLSAREIYRQMLSIITLPNMRSLILIFLTCRIGFAVADSVTPLQLVSKGFRKDNLALIVTLAFPFEFVFALIAGRWAANSNGRPFSVWMFGYRLRIVIATLGLLLVALFPTEQANNLPFAFYIFIMLVVLLYSLSSNFMFVSQGAFFGKIADKRIGGTYMTLLNTLSNFGGTWPKWPVYTAIDWLTLKHGAASQKVDGGGGSAFELNGYYMVGILCAVVGTSWYLIFRSKITELQDIPEREWHVRSRHVQDSTESRKKHTEEYI